MNRLFDELFEHTDDLCDRMSNYYQIVKLLLQIGTPKKENGNGRLLCVIDFIHANYAQPLSVASLARLAHMSEPYFYTCFKQQFGISPIAYLNHYRLTVASDLLKATDLPVARIAESVGFSDPLYFSKLFHRTFQASPRAYRQSAIY